MAADAAAAHNCAAGTTWSDGLNLCITDSTSDKGNSGTGVSTARCKDRKITTSNHGKISQAKVHFSNNCSQANDCMLKLDSNDPDMNNEYLQACGNMGTDKNCRDQTCSCPCYSPLKTTCICPNNFPE